MENKKMKNLRDQPLTETKRYKIDVSDIFGKSTAQIITELKQSHIIEYDRLKKLKEDHKSKNIIRDQTNFLNEIKNKITARELILEKENLYNKIYEKMKTLNLRSCLIMELWEQSIFYTCEELTKMINWNTDQFNDWYEETL